MQPPAYTTPDVETGSQPAADRRARTTPDSTRTHPPRQPAAVERAAAARRGRGGRMRERREVAIFVNQGLGDVAIALGAIESVVAHHGAGNVVLIVKSPLEEELVRMAVGSPGLRVVAMSHLAGPAGLLWLRLAVRMRRLGVRRAVGIILRDTPQVRFFLSVAGARERVLNEYIDSADPRHKLQQFAEVAERGRAGAAGAGDAAVPYRLAPDVVARAVAAARLPRAEYAVFSPGSGELERHKRWPEAHWADLARRLRERMPEQEIVLLGSRSERPMLERIAAAAGEGTTVAVPGTVAESIGLLARARFVVSGCTGTAHLGALVNTPAVALYGPTNPGWTGPLSDRVEVVRLGMRCSPCYASDFVAGCGAPVCMSGIDPAVVMSAIERLTGGAPASGLPWFPLASLRRATY